MGEKSRGAADFYSVWYTRKRIATEDNRGGGESYCVLGSKNTRSVPAAASKLLRAIVCGSFRPRRLHRGRDKKNESPFSVILKRL